MLKAKLLIAFYSVRSDRQFCEQFDYKLLFRWLLDLDLELDGFDQSNSSRLREHKIKPHIARIDGRKTPGLVGRTTCTEGYKVSQRRKRVEEIVGWLKTVGGMRKTSFIEEARTQIAESLSAAAYNRLRIAKRQAAGGAA